MSAKKYHVSLTETEREEMLRLSKSQRHSERERKRARVLLLADEAKEGGADKDTDIAKHVKVTSLTVNRIRQRFAERGLQNSLVHKEQETRKERLLDGNGEAHLIALVCSAPPDGHKRWGLHLLKDTLIEQQIVETISHVKDTLIEQQIVETISHEAVRQTLKKTNLNRG